MAAYYNEHDRFKADWLRKLIGAAVIADGEVDERDIQQIAAADLRGFRQCHFFAGIGVWSYALRTAGWPDDTPVWTGSCPCQSFSASGNRAGFSDQRHLWPAWFRLIGQSCPEHIFGEQVASKDGLAWFDVVSADLEGEDYAVGAADTCAAGYGAPMLSQRLYFIAESADERRRETWLRNRHAARRVCDGDESGLMEPSFGDGLSRRCRETRDRAEREPAWKEEQRSGPAGLLGTTAHGRLQGCRTESKEERRQAAQRPVDVPSGAVRGFWANACWIYCRDNRFRPIEPGTFPLAHGVANRVGKLRGYGDALCAEQAKGFIEAYLSLRNERSHDE